MIANITTQVEELIYHGYNAQDLADLECNIELTTYRGRFYKATTDWENEDKFNEVYQAVALEKLAENYTGEEGAESATDKQISFITTLFNQHKLPQGASRLNPHADEVKAAFSEITAKLSKKSASALIDDMQMPRPLHRAIAKVKLEGSNVVAE